MVIPALKNRQACLFRCIAVGDVISVYDSRVILNRLLGYRICDPAAGIVHRQIREFVLPAVICRHGLLRDFHTVSKKFHSDLGRTFSILVVVVIPGFGSAHARCLRRVAVGDPVAARSASRDSRRIAFRQCGNLLNRIGDLLSAVPVHGKAGPRVEPFV